MDVHAAALYMSPAPSAGWQSGYAEDCKSSYSGSIPLPASSASPVAVACGEGLCYNAARRSGRDLSGGETC